MSQSPAENPPTPAAQSGDTRLETIRSILLRDDREQLSGQVTAAQTEIAALRADIQQLKAELADVEQNKVNSADIVSTVQSEISQITSSAVQQERLQMAEAIGPMIGAATKVQIRESQEEMQDALAPILIKTIQQSIQEALRDFQRNFDARMQQRAQSNNLLRRLYFGSKGTSASEKAMRDALPYEIREIFLIQTGSGLLLTHYSLATETGDSDLVSAMLTAIRDFVGDAFSADGKETELNEIQYGDQQIVLKNGELAYVAAVIDGIVPPGLGSQLQLLVASLHSEHYAALEAYDGDAETLPAFEPMLSDFSAEITSSHTPEEIPDRVNAFLKGMAISLILLLLLTICIWCWFFIRLFPLAWDGNLAINTPPPITTMQQASQPPLVTMRETVWLYAEPNEESQQQIMVSKGQTFTLISAYGDWHEVQWGEDADRQTGWVLSKSIITLDEIPRNLITPTPNPD